MYYETKRSKLKTIIRNIITKLFRKNSYLLFKYKRILFSLFFDTAINFWWSIDFISDKNKKLKYNIELINKLNFNKEKIEIILNKYGKNFEGRFLDWNYHIFANFSSNDQLKILEIGTFKGETTNFLANIFPNSKIVTIDLPDQEFTLSDKSNSFKVPVGTQVLSDNLYTIDVTDIKEISSEFIKTRKKNLQKENIKFIQMDSFYAIEILEKKSFDFIWIDGDHVMPQVAFDIIQAFHLCKKNGYILCDDIVIKKNYSHVTSTSETYNIINDLTKKNYFKTNYFYQNIRPQNIFLISNFISVSKKLI